MIQHQQIGGCDGAVGQREGDRGVGCQCRTVEGDLATLLVQRYASALAGGLGNGAALASDIPSLIGVQVGEVGVKLGVGQRTTLAGAGDDGAHKKSPVLAV